MGQYLKMNSRRKSVAPAPTAHWSHAIYYPIFQHLTKIVISGVTLVIFEFLFVILENGRELMVEYLALIHSFLHISWLLDWNLKIARVTLLYYQNLCLWIFRPIELYKWALQLGATDFSPFSSATIRFVYRETGIKNLYQRQTDTRT